MRTLATLLFVLGMVSAAWATPIADRAPKGVDLSVSGLTISPQSPKVGDTVTFAAQIEDRGTTAAEGFRATLTLGTRVFDEVVWSEGKTVGSFRKKSSPITVTFQKRWQATASSRLEVKVTVEPLAKQLDRERENNVMTATLAVTAPSQPDLAMSELQIRPQNPQDPAELRVGDTFELHTTVKNLTATPIDAPIDFMLARTTHFGGSNTTYTYPKVQVTLKGFESKEVVLGTSVAAPGPIDFVATVDHTKKLLEADESNNTSPTLVLNPLPSLLPDLICRIILKALRTGVLQEVAARDVVFGEPIRIFAEFQNRGAGPVLVPSRARLEITSAAHVVFDVPTLKKGEKLELEPRGPWMASYGTTLFHLVSDINNDVKETLEGDQAFASVTLRDPNGPHPDLEVSSVRLTNVSTGAAGPFRAGDRFAVAATVKNDSPYPASTLGSFRIAVQTKMNSGTVIDYYYKTVAGSLGNGESRELELYSGLLVSGGTPTVTVVVSADHEDKVVERDEQNNSRSQVFTVSP
jgi:subtilase family serine protease